MPTYEYRCDSCGKETEVFQSITAKPLKKCPHCGKPKLKRLIGIGAGIIFKGSGFYQTDYRSEGYKQAAKAENEKSTPKTDSTSTTTATPTDKPAKTEAAAATPKTEAKKTSKPASKSKPD